MKRIYNYITMSLCALLILGLAACKKVEHSIDDQIVSFNEATVSAIQIGKTLKVGFITNNVNSFDFSIEKNGAALISDKITLDSNQRIVEKTFVIPLDETYIGEANLKITYQSGGETINKLHPITFEESNPQMFIVGGSTGAGWEPTNAVAMTLYGEDSKTTFEAFEYLTADGGFKFLPTNMDWTGGYGKGIAAGAILQDGDAGNLTVPTDGFYRVRMDSEALTYEVLKLSMGIIGSATPTGWDSDTDMAFVGGKGTYQWKITINLVPGKIKFRANDVWGIDFGGTADAITLGGGDIDITSAGSYDLTLDLRPGAYKATIVKK
ncbi:SusF/SusE family outer membrane protein [Sphingobacterium bovistauri]|uniref:SusF/SusE family outer membrane protein n=1 Tax=Sphingobacterium bovistauri TaxID=2781959 RepID=A0ABS7Z8L3_9SPHI|nr:SusF/SusE family outer membrane protein [Sphingobacterium bovistauri]MCA5006500.1 SusF/SusE family outer membrane protein [Sphingobacterium bovistauri]